MAQFSHADFGGMSQWSPGMSMVGEMFNTQLKAKLDALCSDIAAHLDTSETAGGARLRETRSVTVHRSGSDGLVAGRIGEARRGRCSERSPIRGFSRDPPTGDRRPRYHLGIRHRIASDFRRRAGPKRRSDADIHQPGRTCENCGPSEGLRLIGTAGTSTVPRPTFVTFRSDLRSRRPRRPRPRQVLFPSEYGPAVQQRRCGAFGGDERFERGSFSRAFEPARLVVETLQRLHLLVARKLCVLDGRLHDADGLKAALLRAAE